MDIKQCNECRYCNDETKNKNFEMGWIATCDKLKCWIEYYGNACGHFKVKL